MQFKVVSALLFATLVAANVIPQVNDTPVANKASAPSASRPPLPPPSGSPPTGTTPPPPPPSGTPTAPPAHEKPADDSKCKGQGDGCKQVKPNA